MKNKMVKIDLRNMVFEWNDEYEYSQIKGILEILNKYNLEVETVKNASKIFREEIRRQNKNG